MPGLSERIAGYVAGALDRPLPELALARAKHHFLDTLAAIVSGSAMLPGRKGAAFVKSQGGPRESGVLGTRLRTSAVNAALANGLSAHADETDDSHPFSLTHPGSAVVPAALAMAEWGGRTGLELLKGIVAGYDLCARTGMALGASDLRAAGKDCHAFGGIMGATAAAAALAGLDTRRTAMAFSYGAQQAAGLATLFRDPDHVEKAFVFSGGPARNGVSAALMVASGMTGVADPFDGSPNFLSAHSVIENPQRAFRGLGRPLEITRTNIKRWSVGSPAQAVLDSLEALVATRNFRPDDVAHVAAHLTPRAALVVDNQRIRDINLQFLAAVMLIDGTLTFESSHDAARAGDPRVMALANKVEVVPDAALPADQAKRQAIVVITLHSGRKLKHRTRVVRGTTENPMTREEVEAKAMDLMAPVIGAHQTRQVFKIIRRLEKVRKLDPLIALLQGR